jgi:glycosyltransferase involved in cell wall biosynthesis
MHQASIIIATHHRPHLLPRAVESARQAGNDVEIVVVDDASTDETATVCSRLPGIKYIRLERNQGVAGARNVGLLNSDGEFISFLDDDDLRLPGSIDLQIQALVRNPEAAFVCGGMIIADQNYQPTGEITHPGHPGGDVFWTILELDFPVMGLSTLIRKDCLFHVGLLRQHLSGIDDWDIFVRLAEIYPVVVIPEPVGVYREATPDSDQGSSARASQLCRAARHQRQLLQLPRVAAASRQQRRAVRRRMVNRIADTLLWTADRQLPKGQYKAAARNIDGALRLNPLRAVRPNAYWKLGKSWVRKKPASVHD